MIHSTPVEATHEVVWHGGMANDPLGGFTKGCLLPPRMQTEHGMQTEHELTRSLWCAADDDVTLAELVRGVERLTQSLRRPPVPCPNQYHVRKEQRA